MARAKTSVLPPWTAAPSPGAERRAALALVRCTDAERRAALALLRRLRARLFAAHRGALGTARVAGLAGARVAGVVGAVLSVDHPPAGLIVAAGAFVLSAARSAAVLPLGRARATQDVVARRAPAPRRPRVTRPRRPVDRPRTTSSAAASRRSARVAAGRPGVTVALAAGPRRPARTARARLLPSSSRRRSSIAGGRRSPPPSPPPWPRGGDARRGAVAALGHRRPDAPVGRGRLRRGRRARAARAAARRAPRARDDRPGSRLRRAVVEQRAPDARPRSPPRPAAARRGRALPSGERPALAAGGAPAGASARARRGLGGGDRRPAASVALVRQLDEVVERARVGQRLAAGGLVGDAPMRMRLTGTSSALPDSVRGTSSISWISLGTWRGEQSSRIALLDAPDEVVVEGRALAQHDEERHPAVRALARDVDDQRVDDSSSAAPRCRSRSCPSGSRRG